MCNSNTGETQKDPWAVLASLSGETGKQIKKENLSNNSKKGIEENATPKTELQPPHQEQTHKKPHPCVYMGICTRKQKNKNK